VGRFYFDQREQRTKPMPDCGAYGLSWIETEQRCNELGCLERIMDWSDYQQRDDRQMGFAAFNPPSGGGGGGFPGLDPISGIISGVTDIIGGLVRGARQRGSDEAKSGVALQASVDSIFYLRDAVSAGDVTKKQAKDAFYLQILPAFLNFISQLQTKSVVESRLKNQRQDLINLFESQVMVLPDSVMPTPPIQSAESADSSDDFLPDTSGFEEFDFGEIEYYDDQGGYYYEDRNGWYYEDAAGNYQQQDADGNLYAGNESTGEYWQTVDGETYWEAGDGSFYLEYPDGSWTSADALGNQCDGDGDGNWTCEDGSAGGDWRESPIRVPKQQGQTRRQQQIGQQSQFDKYLKQAISLIPKKQRQQQNAQRAQSPRGIAQRSTGQERLLNAQPKSISGSGLFSGVNTKTLLIIGGLVVGFIVLKNR
jgi:hypothetical protein